VSDITRLPGDSDSDDRPRVRSVRLTEEELNRAMGAFGQYCKSLPMRRVVLRRIAALGRALEGR